MRREPEVLFLCTHNSAAAKWLKSSSGAPTTAFAPTEPDSSLAPSTPHQPGDGEGGLRDLSKQACNGVKDYLRLRNVAYTISVYAHADEACSRVFPTARIILNWPSMTPPHSTAPARKPSNTSAAYAIISRLGSARG